MGAGIHGIGTLEVDGMMYANIEYNITPDGKTGTLEGNPAAIARAQLMSAVTLFLSDGRGIKINVVTIGTQDIGQFEIP